MNDAHTIWKFCIPIEDQFEIEMPVGSVLLDVQLQGHQPCLWVLCDPEKERESRRFALRGTGHWLHPAGWTYVGTFQILGGRLIYHLFTEEVAP